jgi:hypothetical protein
MPMLSLKFRLEPIRAANARSKVVWGESADRNGKRHKGYIRQHLANASDKRAAAGLASEAVAGRRQ